MNPSSQVTRALVAIGLLAGAARQADAQYPFEVGETLRYEARLGIVPAGTAVMRVSGTARDRGDAVLVLSMTGQGGSGMLAADLAMTSWVGVDKFTSRRFHRRATFRGEATDERYRIIPDSTRYRLEGATEAWTAPATPLDELAFLYYLRTLPLRPGESFSVRGYFKNGYNPVRVRVLGRERIELPSGEEVSCIALSVAAAGLTSHIWLTDDARRIPARLRVPTPMGRVTFGWMG